MSIQVGPDELGDALRVYRHAFLITVGSDARAHVVPATPAATGGGVIVGGLGRRSLANVAANPAVTLLWPPTEPEGHSLILDGTASVDANGGSTISVAVQRAVLHRSGPGDPPSEPDGCAADCAEIAVDR
jgi:hypothetical protein